MPIKGLTDRESLAPRWPRLGKLRKGAAKERGKIGKDLDYFRFTSDDPVIVEAFKDVYGDTPSSIKVFLPYATPEENFQTWQEEWVASGLVHRCDREICKSYRKPDGTMAHDPISCPYADGKKERTKSSPGCKEIGRLSVVLPGLIHAGFGGEVVFETGSNHDLRIITSTLYQVEAEKKEFLAKMAGAIRDGRLMSSEAQLMAGEGLQGIPFLLQRYQDVVSAPTDNGRIRVKKSLVRLVPVSAWMTNQLKAAEAGAFAILSPGNNLEDVDPPESLDDSADNDEDDIGVAVVELPEFGSDDKDAIETKVVEPPEYTLEWATGIDTGEPNHTPLGELSGDQLTWLIENVTGVDVKRAALLLLDAMEEAAVTESDPEVEAEPETASSTKADALEEFVGETGAEVTQIEM